MNLEQNWKDLNAENDNDLTALLQPGKLQKLQSIDPLQRIKHKLRINMVWALLISLMYILILFFFPHWQVMVGIGIILGYTVFGGFTAYRLYKNIDLPVTGNLSLLQELEKHYWGIHGWMRFQQQAAVFAYPVGCIGGMLVGFLLFSGKTTEYTLSRPGVVGWMLLTTVVLAAGGWWLGKRLLQKSFGKHLQELKSRIDALKKAE